MLIAEGVRKLWLVTGVAGFIGSNLLEALLRSDQRVRGLDNLSTGSSRNLQDVREKVGAERWQNFRMIEADICDWGACVDACTQVDYVLHQAALGSVPRSISNPIATNQSNVNGFVNMFCAAKEAGVKRFVFASSSSVYGDSPTLPKVEEQIGNGLSPYAVSKRANELYADVFSRCYGMQTIGLRYFNVFGPRQDPDGPYAAVIPKWIGAMMHNEPVHINGDGETSRDFCYVANAVQANLLAATTEHIEAINQVYNVAVGERTTLNQLFCALRDRLLPQFPHLMQFKPLHREFRAGDVRHSHADISKARKLLGYEPTHRIDNGLDEALQWYVANLSHRAICEGALQV
jgi:UDP-N-acetylglucosamine/UDP-N-acetyl-alpha-D-glucosaminouronate 4-epimerase